MTSLSELSTKRNGKSTFPAAESTIITFVFGTLLKTCFPYIPQTETKESKWDMPDELLLLLEKVEKDAKATQVAAAYVVPSQVRYGT